MNKSIVILAVLFFILCFISCEKPNPCCDICTGCDKIEINNKECFMMCITPNVVSDHSASIFRLENHTKNTLNYSRSFELEYFNENQWIPLEVKGPWPDDYLGLLSGKTEEGNISLYNLAEKYNDSKKGKYRFVKGYNLHDKHHAMVDSYDLKVEFEIK